MATLRITKIKQKPSLILLNVEGAVGSESVWVLEEECKGWLKKKNTVQLDFSGVTSIDHEGVKMLRKMASAHLQVIHCPDFIHRLLNLKARG